MKGEKNPFYKKLSWRITREGSKQPFKNNYTFKFTTSQFLEEVDDFSSITSFSHNDFKEMLIDALVEDFRISLNSVVFGEPAGREYVEHLNEKNE